MSKKGIRTLFEDMTGAKVRLSPQLRARYGGDIAFGKAKGRPYIFNNFVSTLDGIVSFQIPGRSSGGTISGFNADDQFVMGLLRSLSDAVVIGSGTLNDGSSTAFVPAVICPRYKKEYDALRKRLGKPREPMNVILTASGNVSLDKPIFRYPNLKTLILTTDRGMKRLKERYGKALNVTEVRSVGNTRSVAPRKAAQILYRKYGVKLLLHEGGPTVFGEYLKAGIVDEMFLTLSPQVAGRTRGKPRLGFAGQTIFSPDSAPWYTLKGAKQAGSHLFLRYVRA